jgi:polyhydroxybutyrate depolymerase
MIFILPLIFIAATLTVVFWLRGRSRPRRPAGPVWGPAETVELPVDGAVRRYYLLRGPMSLRERATQPRPLILGFHGGNGNPARFAENSRLPYAALGNGFVLALPEAQPRWADGRSAVEGAWPRDIAFLDRLAGQLSQQPDLDTENLFGVGLSNGAMFTLRLGCEFGRRFRGLASVLGSMPVDYVRKVPPGAPVPLMLVNASHDRLVPPEGGEMPTAFGLAAGGNILSVDDTIRFWRARNRCSGAPTRERRKIGRHNADIVTWPGGADGAELSVVTLLGAGHRWPPAAGRGTMSIEQLIMRFFARQLPGNTDGAPVEPPSTHSIQV